MHWPSSGLPKSSPRPCYYYTQLLHQKQWRDEILKKLSPTIASSYNSMLTFHSVRTSSHMRTLIAIPCGYALIIITVIAISRPISIQSQEMEDTNYMMGSNWRGIQAEMFSGWNSSECKIVQQQGMLCFFFCTRPWLQLTLIVSMYHLYSSLPMEVPRNRDAAVAANKVKNHPTVKALLKVSTELTTSFWDRKKL